MQDLTIPLGMFIAAVVQILKTIGMPKNYAFGLVVIFGITAAIIFQFANGAWPMVLACVETIASAIASYETVKRITNLTQ